MLATLPDRELRCGLAEVVKYGVILDAAFFAELEDQADAILDARRPGLAADRRRGAAGSRPTSSPGTSARRPAFAPC